MILTDILLILALAVFVLAWWVRRTPARATVLAVSALVALIAAILGVLDDRWQAAPGAAVAGLLLVALLVNRLRKSGAARGVPIFSGLAFTLPAGAAIAALALFPIAPLPAPDGPHAVGVRNFELTDTERKGVLGATPDAPRRLLVRVWYPAASVSGLRARRYFTPQEARTTATGLGALFGFPPFLSHLKHVRTNAYADAQLLAGAERLPVIFYSHGYTSFLGQNAALMEHLASHGYVVFSIQHTLDSSPTVFADGEIVPLSPDIFAEGSSGPSAAAIGAITGETPERRLEGALDLFDEETARGARIVVASAPHWLRDRLLVHDRLEAGAVPPAIAEIAAAGDLAHVGEMGMSFGGSAAGAVCMIDPRCAAGVNLDGADYHFLAFDADIPVPFLMFHSDPRLIYASLGADPDAQPRTFNEFSYERIETAGDRADVYRVSLRETHHLGLSDFSLFVRRPVRDALFGAAPPAVTIGAQNAFVRGFFDQHLRGEQADFPQAPLAAYADWVRPVDVGDVKTWWAGLDEPRRAELRARIEAARATAPSAAIVSRR